MIPIPVIIGTVVQTVGGVAKLVEILNRKKVQFTADEVAELMKASHADADAVDAERAQLLAQSE